MTTTHTETTITLSADVPMVTIVREFDAPAEAVFRAHADPALFARWIGPRDLTTTCELHDCRTGGAYRFVQRRGEDEFAFRGTFHDVRPGELIVQTFTWEGMPDHVALEKLYFEDLGDGRSCLTATSLVDSFADRDAFVVNGMEEGIREGYDQLDELLAD